MVKGVMLRTLKKLGFGKRHIPRPGDYYNDDGVLICGACGKAREWHGEWPGIGMTWAACICDCDKSKILHNRTNEELSQKKMLARMRREYAFPFDEALKNITLLRDDKANMRVSEAVRKYINNIDRNFQNGRNVLFFGGVGTGKTFFAAAILNAAIEAGYKCLFTSFFHEINELSNARDKNEFLRNLKNYDFVVFDDFGTERETEYTLEQIYQIVNARYLACRPTIFTTNLGVNDFSSDDTAKARIFSRIFEKCEIILCNGYDRRKTNAKKINK
ncbi:MAG: ATP-binding protein [Oscillospiraceae bacterium]|nr:ATP-binding protein [Oscillospiraceae bacterium]